MSCDNCVSPLYDCRLILHGLRHPVSPPQDVVAWLGSQSAGLMTPVKPKPKPTPSPPLVRTTDSHADPPGGELDPEVVLASA